MNKDNLYHSWVNTFLAKEIDCFTFSARIMKAILKDDSGLVNAPTGSGKTFQFFPHFMEKLNSQKPLNLLYSVYGSPHLVLVQTIQLSIQDF